MEEASQHGQVTATSSGDGRTVDSDNLTEKPLPPEVDRIVSANPSLDAAVAGPSSHVANEPESSNTDGITKAAYPPSAHSREQSLYYGGYDNSTGNWDEYPHYVNANSLQVVPPVRINLFPLHFSHSPSNVTHLMFLSCLTQLRQWTMIIHLLSFIPVMASILKWHTDNFPQ
ncbi:uncharacterized protein LOC132276907 [Cornus florida]|uniref:uncharacterized protein LOC132276907 n=1 Tax=Cornus florida TaxID=4283 RepID=UPI002898517F|nr:uncharacterized protein LOC132276907 [Cornus florida]